MMNLLCSQCGSPFIPGNNEQRITHENEKLHFHCHYCGHDTVVDFPNRHIVMAFTDPLENENYAPLMDYYSGKYLTAIMGYDSYPEFVQGWLNMMNLNHMGMWYWILVDNQVACSGIPEEGDLETVRNFIEHPPEVKPVVDDYGEQMDSLIQEDGPTITNSKIIVSLSQIPKNSVKFQGMEDGNGEIRFLMDPQFNVDKVFNLFVNTTDNDDFITIYAIYDLAKDAVCGYLRIFYETPDHSDEILYIMDSKELKIVSKAMEQYCSEQTQKSLSDYAKECWES